MIDFAIFCLFDLLLRHCFLGFFDAYNLREFITLDSSDFSLPPRSLT